MKKIAVYDPYLDVLGGGEKHILSIVQVFEQCGYTIDLFWDDAKILEHLAKQLHITFQKVHIIPSFTSFSFIRKLMKTKEYEYFFYVTDGSYFFSLARHNYIFSMYPQQSLYRSSFLNRLKWTQWNFIANSLYTQSYIEKWTGKKSEVIYPYLDILPFEKVQSYKKDKIILTVGRFFKHLHAKRQDILIKAFKQLQQKDKSFKDFRLYLIGGLKEEDKYYFKELVSLAEGNPNIIFIPNAPQEVVTEYYRKALFYWHAAGYGVDESIHPEAVEHLGITPLEAMVEGCVVFCHASGGPKNIISDGVNGFLYDTIKELIDKTARIYTEASGIEAIRYQAYTYIKSQFAYNVFKKKMFSYFKLPKHL
ncbi:MAG TPA: glycosyltransferase family 4 protein [Patescibacteria group bacterium]|nr:glycosyltransferase family 4 protein [Patescibacteria group bacterium]